jgi:type VI secretion system protein ImpA
VALDLAALLAPVSAEAPSGEAVEYDPQFNELETAARGTPEREVGDTIIPGEEPDWREVDRIALELAARSKDLRVAIYLLRAQQKLAGLAGLQAGLELIRGYVADFWPSVHPQLDPEDDNDPSARVNALAGLCDAELMLPVVRLIPLTQSRQIGRMTFRDYALAAGLMAPPTPKKGQEKEKPSHPDAGTVDAAFTDTAVEVLQANQAAAAAALEALSGIDKTVSQALGGAPGPELDPLRKLLRDIKGLLDHQLSKRGVTGAAAAPAEESAELGTEAAEAAPATSRGGGGSGVIRDRGDVVLLLDRICRYYADHEPSSPVPLILERAKRLATMNFLDILRDLTPEGVQTIGVIAGIKDEASSE